MDWMKLVVKTIEIVFLGYFLVTLNFPQMLEKNMV